MHTHKYTQRYVGDANPIRTKHVHDLDNEKPSCTIHSIEWRGNNVAFPTKDAAYAAGYVPCIFCMPYEKGTS